MKREMFWDQLVGATIVAADDGIHGTTMTVELDGERFTGEPNCRWLELAVQP